MYKKTFMALVCAAITSMGALFSAASYATAFQVNFDPYTDLYGAALLDVQTPCLAHDGSFSGGSLLSLFVHGCTVSLVSAHISTDGAPDVCLSCFQDYVAETNPMLLQVLVIVNHQLAGLQTFSPLPVRLEEAGVQDAPHIGGHEDCDATLAFFATGGSNGLGSVSFRGCSASGAQLDALPGGVTSIFRVSALVVPEPATLALVLGGIAAGWVTRRRKRAA